MSDEVRALCRRRRRGEPCIRTLAEDMITIVANYECVGWCPLLQRLIPEGGGSWDAYRSAGSKTY